MKLEGPINSPEIPEVGMNEVAKVAKFFPK